MIKGLSKIEIMGKNITKNQIKRIPKQPKMNSQKNFEKC